MQFDLEQMREIVKRAPTSNLKVRRMRLNLFDMYRYNEEYEKIYQMVQDLIKP